MLLIVSHHVDGSVSEISCITSESFAALGSFLTQSTFTHSLIWLVEGCPCANVKVAKLNNMNSRDLGNEVGSFKIPNYVI